VAHVAVKLPEFWVKDPKMWFSQAEAQFRRARVTQETTMYDYVLMKLPQDVVMSVRALISAIEADPVKQEASYTLLKEALMGSFGMTKWQMAYALLDHPDLGDRRPSAMMAEMLALRFETTPPDSLFLALFLRRVPTSIRDHLAAANHETATAMATHADILWDARNSASVSTVSEALAAVSVRSASPRASRSPDRRARSPDRRRQTGQQTRPPTPGRQDGRVYNKDGLCKNHRKYGAKAYNCTWKDCKMAEN
jgi:HEPN domain-containing protein